MWSIYMKPQAKNVICCSCVGCFKDKCKSFCVWNIYEALVVFISSVWKTRKHYKNKIRQPFENELKMGEKNECYAVLLIIIIISVKYYENLATPVCIKKKQVVRHTKEPRANNPALKIK